MEDHESNFRRRSHNVTIDYSNNIKDTLHCPMLSNTSKVVIALVIAGIITGAAIVLAVVYAQKAQSETIQKTQPETIQVRSTTTETFGVSITNSLILPQKTNTTLQPTDLPVKFGENLDLDFGENSERPIKEGKFCIVHPLGILIYLWSELKSQNLGGIVFHFSGLHKAII